ncbi:hypothetical protein FRX31_030868, partial [Thalictrum thalictroides]
MNTSFFGRVPKASPSSSHRCQPSGFPGGVSLPASPKLHPPPATGVSLPASPKLHPPPATGVSLPASPV